MVRGADHCAPLRMEYRSSSDSTQLISGLPSWVRDQFTCELPGPEGLAAGSTFKDWPNNGSASMGRKRTIGFFMEPYYTISQTSAGMSPGAAGRGPAPLNSGDAVADRSEERRVGK